MIHVRDASLARRTASMTLAFAPGAMGRARAENRPTREASRREVPPRDARAPSERAERLERLGRPRRTRDGTSRRASDAMLTRATPAAARRWARRLRRATARRETTRDGAARTPARGLARDAGRASATTDGAETASRTTFRDLGVGARLTRALERAGVETPSIAQRAAMPAIARGENVAMQSHTGSGKTLAYLLPVICDIVDDETGTVRRDAGNGVRALVVAPSQELAMQIVRQVERLLGDLGREITQQAIGGANAKRQEEAIRRKRPLIVVGTPGRLAELSRTGILQTHGVKTLVVDEADDLLASNFRRDMARISEHTGKAVPGGRQTVIVSATLKQETLDAYSYLAPNLTHIVATYDKPSPTALTTPGEDEEVEEADVADARDEKSASAAARQERMQGVVSLPPHITHCSVISERRHKVDELRRAIHATDVQRALIFCNFGRRLEEVQAKLSARRMPVGVLHGGMDKMERQKELAKFRRGEFRALVVSDLAARGLDVDDCDAVFNLELPTDETHYVHRAGRTGRMGSPGVVVTIAEPQEAFVLERFERNLGVKINDIATKGGEVVRAAPECAPRRGGGKRAPKPRSV